MKKFYFIVIVFAMTLFASCGNQSEQADEQTATDSTTVVRAENPQAKAMDLAVRLARYGYENESAEALIGAADVLISLQAERLDVKPEKEGGEAPAVVDERKPLDIATLIADARALAGEDQILLQMVERAEQMLAQMGSDASRGPSSNSGYITESIYAHQADVYKIEFIKNRAAAVTVTGNGATDLNLYIYDEDGEPVTNDMGPTDKCYCEWTPTKNGNYIIKIINRGNETNEYTVFIER